MWRTGYTQGKNKVKGLKLEELWCDVEELVEKKTIEQQPNNQKAQIAK